MNEDPIKKLRAELNATQTDMWHSLSMLWEKVEELEQEKQEPEDKEEDMVPEREDVGQWVEVRDTHDSNWSEPVLLTQVDPNDPNLPYRAADLWWHQARIVPRSIRGTLQKHDGSHMRPMWLNHDDMVIVEFQDNIRMLLSVISTSWHLVKRFQKIEIK